MYTICILDCVKDEFKSLSKVGESNFPYKEAGSKKTRNVSFPNCTTPWHQSLLGILDYNETDVTVCDSVDAFLLYKLDYQFIDNVVKGKSKCTGIIRKS